MPSKVDDLLDYYCYECHDSGTQKGEVRLDDLASLKQEGAIKQFLA
ncbi:MAG: c-type cytochrome domain-containing protein [Akkermansiaceae bacterium]